MKTLVTITVCIEIFCAIVAGICAIACLALPVNHPIGLVFLALIGMAAILITMLCGGLLFVVVKQYIDRLVLTIE